MYCAFPRKARLPHKSQRRPLAAALQGSSVYCVPHESQLRASGGHARSSVYCASQLRPSGDHACSSSRRLCVLRLPHDSQPRPAYCACHATPSAGQRQLLQEALCTAPATRQPAAGQRRPRAQQLLQEALYPHDSQPRAVCDYARSSSSARKLCVLRLPHDSRPRASGDQARSSSSRKPCMCTAPATRQPAAGQRRPRSRKPCDSQPRASSRRLCVLRLPRDSQPRASGDHVQRLCVLRLSGQLLQEDHAHSSSFRRLCVLHQPVLWPATRAAAPAGGSLYCACHTTARRGPVATTRAAACAGSSVYCACHTTASRAPADHARSSLSRKLCVLRLPHDSLPRASGDHARSSSSRRLCVLRLPHDSQPAAGQRRPRVQQLLRKAPYCACHCCHKWCDELCCDECCVMRWCVLCCDKWCDDELCCHKWCDECCVMRWCVSCAVTSGVMMSCAVTSGVMSAV